MSSREQDKMCKINNIFILILVSFSLNNLVSSNSLAAINTDLDNIASKDNLSVKASTYSRNAAHSLLKRPDAFTSKCCGNQYVKKDDRRKRSVGSKNALSTEYPWVVLLEYPGSSVCTGMLISNLYVLTAAHCIVNVPNRPTSVRLGQHGEASQVICSNSKEGRTCNDGAISVPIENITVHSNYNITQSWKNDIAIIKLKEIVHYSEYIQPICLPTFEVTEKLDPDVFFEFAGWGTTKNKIISQFGGFDVNYPSGVQFTKVEKIAFNSNDVCQKLYNTKVTRGTYKIHDTHMCAGGVKGQGPCSGDSGGPLMYKKNNRYVAVGILSFTTVPCAYEDVPAVFTNIYKYDHWIREHISKNNNVIFEESNNLICVENSNHGTVLTCALSPLFVILFCFYYILM